MAAAVSAAWLVRRLSVADTVRLAAGFAIPVAIVLAVFAIAGTLRPLIDATIFYNLQYSGETYGVVSPLQYLATFPIERARADALWTLGGAGCLFLLAGAGGSRVRLVPVVWVAAACVSIAINGSRSLPLMAACLPGGVLDRVLSKRFGLRRQF